MSANDIQHGGSHYKQFKGHEPWDVVSAWGLGYLDGTALKYISRWRQKNGIEDLHKAVHFLQKLIELERSNSATVSLESFDNLCRVQDAHGALGAVGGFCNSADVLESIGNPNLNTTPILRPDNV